MLFYYYVIIYGCKLKNMARFLLQVHFNVLQDIYQSFEMKGDSTPYIQ